jgi:hypothetical protein
MLAPCTQIMFDPEQFSELLAPIQARVLQEIEKKAVENVVYRLEDVLMRRLGKAAAGQRGKK